MERHDEDLRGGSEAQEKFENVAKPPTEDTDVGSGAGGGSTGPGVTGITGTGATNSTGMNTGTTSTGATGTGMLDTGTGVTGAAGMERTVPDIGGHGIHADPPSRLSSGTGAVGGVGPVGTSSRGREHMRDPMQSGADNPMNELTPDDRGGGIGMFGAGTGTPETQEAEEWPRERE